MTVEDFDQPGKAGADYFAYYLASGMRVWSGKLPAGDIRLRVRVTLPRRPEGMPERCEVKLGPYVIEGPIDGEWST